MTRVLSWCCLIFLVAACSGSGESGVDGASPARVVRVWLDAVGGPDPAIAGEQVDQTTLALITAIENGLDPEETVSLIDLGMPADAAAAYWGSFAGSFAEFSGRPIATLRVGAFELLEPEHPGYAAVELKSGDVTTEVITVRGEDGTWRIDLVGTLGPGFVRIMLDDFLELPNTDAAKRLVGVYADTVVPALQAAVARRPGADFVMDARNLIAEVGIRQRAG